jgi:N-sulfoglucosamine sulfohydrolase
LYIQGKLVLPFYIPDINESREEYAQYAQAVSRLDLGIGRLLELLHKSGQWEQTVVIYLSSTGPDFPGVQNNMDEENLHMPLLIKPAFYNQKNRVCDAMVSMVDVLPSILDISGVLYGDELLHGRSFGKVMFEAHPDSWDEVYASHTFDEITAYYPMRSIENRQYKLIWNIAWPLTYPLSNSIRTSATWHGIVTSKNPEILGKSLNFFFHRPEFELYDLLKDPQEIYNQADNPENREIFESLKRKLKDFLVRTNDPWIVSWKN